MSYDTQILDSSDVSTIAAAFSKEQCAPYRENNLVDQMDVDIGQNFVFNQTFLEAWNLTNAKDPVSRARMPARYR